MTASLREEISQTAPFRSLEQEAIVSLVRTAARLVDSMDTMLRCSDLGTAQYNVLRILRGAEPDGICRNALRDRMVTRMPDMTRLLDRMEEGGLVRRCRDSEDRRMVMTHITDAGRRLVDDLDEPIEELHQRLLGHMSDAQLRMLIDLLAQARACV